MTKRIEFDVVVVGGGHAGCEAAAVASRMGTRVALVTFAKSTLGVMSCNPAIGGVGKGHLVREVDALDGVMGLAADHAGIHYRMLNQSKGKAVHGPRVQADRRRYAQAVCQVLAHSAVEIIGGEASSLNVKGDQVDGVTLADGTILSARALVIATGTFLAAQMFCGREVRIGGRAGEASSNRLAAQLRELDLPMGRLKTGTPPRLDGRTIAWEKLSRQASDLDPWTMSPLSRTRTAPQLFCGITRTRPETHDIIRAAFDRSPLHSGAIASAGPRYCPSIEDKVVRFGDRDGHQIFLEPEGLDTPLVYPNGISTSLPQEVQLEFVRSIGGLERAEIVKPGYAVEYEYVDPRALDKRLALRALGGLFLAGQINGTTGYEEAAGQGIVAGMNAASLGRGGDPILFQREDSYIGVMIDDLTIQGVSEPYRMLTARAEYRLRLRADNAETRLDHIASKANCLSAERNRHRVERLEAFARLKPQIETQRRNQPDLTFASLVETSVGEELIEDARYAPYVERQAAEIANAARDRRTSIPDGFDYSRVPGLSNEMKERLHAAGPANLEEVARISGITPAAVAAVLVASRRKAA